MSSTIASIILRKLSACCCSFELKLMREILVSPSTT